MRWGRRQQQQQQRQHRSSFSLSNVLPLSWISKLAAKTTRTTRPSPAPRSPPVPARSAADHLSFEKRGSRSPLPLHDAPRRLSVGEDDTLLARARTSHARTLLRSARHNSVGDLEWRPFSGPCPGFELTESLRRSRRWPRDPGTTTSDSENEPVLVRRRRPTRRRRNGTPSRADGGASEGTLPAPCGARKSFSGKVRHINKPKVRVYSPRPSAASRAEIRRIKTAARRWPAASAEVEEGLESFAVVKCSCDPQKDFRDSMVEMIWERGIGRPEELERLLACYLSLNSDEHHDVIVKVFRQIWFELNPARLAPYDSCCRHRFN